MSIETSAPTTSRGLPTICVALMIVLTIMSPTPTRAAPPWRDPAVVALDREASAGVRTATHVERAATSQVAAAMRAEARAEQIAAREGERAATLEAKLPEAEAAATTAATTRAAAREAQRAALKEGRAAQKIGGATWRAAEAKVVAANKAYDEAKLAQRAANGALTAARRGLDKARMKLGEAAREGEAARAQRVAAEKGAAAAGEARAAAERWQAVTKALAAHDHPAALAALEVSGTGREGARAFVRCVALAGADPARVQACDQAAAERPSAARYAALALFAAGSLDEALRRTARFPWGRDDAELRAAMGMALAAAGRHAEAAPLLEAALAIGGDDAATLDALARADVALGKDEAALAALERLALIDPERPGLAYRRALVYASAGETVKAQALLASFVGARASGGDPSYAACQRDLYREALPPSDVKLPSAPDRGLAHVFLALQAERDGDRQTAETRFADAEAASPDDAEVRLQRGLFALRAGDAKAAEAHLAFAHARMATDARARLGLGVALSRLGRSSEAAKVLAPAADVPSDDAGRLALAIVYARIGDARADATLAQVKAPALREAADHAAAVLAYYRRQGGTGDVRRFAAFAEGRLLSGLVALEGGDAAGALAAIEAALAGEPSYLQAHLAHGRALDQLGRNADAVVALRRAVAIDPGCADAHLQLGAALARGGQGEAAAAEYRKAEALAEAQKKRAAEAGGATPGEPGPTPPTGSTPVGPRRVAVVQFINATKDPAVEWLSFGIAEAVSTDLAQLSRLEVVERGQVASLMREIKFASMDFVDAKTAPKLGELLGVEALVVGSYQIVGDTLRIDGRLVELSSQRVLESGAAEGKVDGLFALERQLTLALVGRWARVGDAERAALITAPTGNVGGLEQLALTRMKMLQGDSAGAKDAYREAVKRSPELARRVKDLRAAYEDAEARVAVLPFKNVTGDPESEWIGVGIAESLATDMRKIGLYVVERAEIAKALAEQKFGQIVEPERAARLGLVVGAQVILLGSYQSVGDLLAIDARMVQVATGAVVLTERVSGKTADFFALQRELSAKIAAALDMQVSVEELTALMGDAPDLGDFKDTILKDRLFVLRDKDAAAAADAGADDGPSVAPLAIGLGGLALAVAGGVMFGLGESDAAASERELVLYRRAVDPDEMDLRFRRARDLDASSDTLHVASYVAFGLAGAAAVYTTWALIDQATDEPTTDQRVDVVLPKVTPSLTPGGAGVVLDIGF